RITAGGSILDNLSSENANLIAHTAVLNAGASIGSADDLNTEIAVLWGSATHGSINLNELDNIQLGTNLSTLLNPDFQNIVAPNGSIAIHAGGLIHIQDGSFLQSAAGTYSPTGHQIVTGSTSPSGKVSNAPPIIELHQINPHDVLLPGDPTQ